MPSKVILLTVNSVLSITLPMALVTILLLEAFTAHSPEQQRVLRDTLNSLDSYSDSEFISRYRITRCIFIELQGRIECFLNRTTHRSHDIPITTQLAVALHFPATGSFQTVIAAAHGISQPSVSECISVVIDALCSFSKEYMTFPNPHKQIHNQQLFLVKGGFTFGSRMY